MRRGDSHCYVLLIRHSILLKRSHISLLLRVSFLLPMDDYSLYSGLARMNLLEKKTSLKVQTSVVENEVEKNGGGLKEVNDIY